MIYKEALPDQYMGSFNRINPSYLQNDLLLVPSNRHAYVLSLTNRNAQRIPFSANHTVDWCMSENAYFQVHHAAGEPPGIYRAEHFHDGKLDEIWSGRITGPRIVSIQESDLQFPLEIGVGTYLMSGSGDLYGPFDNSGNTAALDVSISHLVQSGTRDRILYYTNSDGELEAESEALLENLSSVSEINDVIISGSGPKESDTYVLYNLSDKTYTLINSAKSYNLCS